MHLQPLEASFNTSIILLEAFPSPKGFGNLFNLDFKSSKARNSLEEYVARGMIPAKYRADAEHIAVASLEGFDALASWNLRHIVKLKTKSMVRLINRETGYSVPEIIRQGEVL